jgi:hypothetical protein
MVILCGSITAIWIGQRRLTVGKNGVATIYVVTILVDAVALSVPLFVCVSQHELPKQYMKKGAGAPWLRLIILCLGSFWAGTPRAISYSVLYHTHCQTDENSLKHFDESITELRYKPP